LGPLLLHGVFLSPCAFPGRSSLQTNSTVEACFAGRWHNRTWNSSRMPTLSSPGDVRGEGAVQEETAIQHQAAMHIHPWSHSAAGSSHLASRMVSRLYLAGNKKNSPRRSAPPRPFSRPCIVTPIAAAATAIMTVTMACLLKILLSPELAILLFVVPLPRPTCFGCAICNVPPFSPLSSLPHWL